MPDDILTLDETEKTGLALHPVLAARVNFATAQNGVAVIKRLGI